MEELPLEDSLELVAQTALELMPQANHASVRLLDDTGNQLLSAGRAGAGATSVPLSFRPGEGLAGWVVENGQVARVDDVDEDARFVKRPSQGFSVRSLLAVPLWSSGHVVGVLALSAPKHRAIGDQDVLLASLLANCAVPTIERARLERLALTDANTAAFNRRYLTPRLREEMGRAERTGSPLSLLMMDLDHFKRVNDEHGHPVGDEVLRWFAERVRDAVRPQDVLVPWRGEESVLVRPATPLELAESVAERIRDLMAAHPFVLRGGAPLVQTVSIGAAAWDGRENAESLEHRADDALYAAKRAGRDRVISAD